MESKTISEGNGKSARTPEATPKTQGSRRPFLESEAWTRTVAVLSMCLHIIVLFMSIFTASVMYGEDRGVSWIQHGAVLIAPVFSSSGFCLAILLFLEVEFSFGADLYIWVAFTLMAQAVFMGGTFLYLLDMDPSSTIFIIMAASAFCSIQSFSIWVVNHYRKEMERQEIGKDVLLDESLVRNGPSDPKAVGKSSSSDTGPLSQQQQQQPPSAVDVSSRAHQSSPPTSGYAPTPKKQSKFPKSLETVPARLSPRTILFVIPENKVISFRSEYPPKVPSRDQSLAQ